MKCFVKDLQKLRIVVSFYRNQILFWLSGQTLEEQLGFGFAMRCQTIMNGIDPMQKELISLLMDESLPLQRRLTAITSRLDSELEELKAVVPEETLETYRVLYESIYFDITEMKTLLGDFVAEADN